MFDQLEKASKSLNSLPTAQPNASRQQNKDISQSRLAVGDVSTRRRPSEIARVKAVQPQSPSDKVEQELIRQLVNYFE